jgi:hypothetical protein
MIRMLIVGYCFGIRSERRLCEEVSLNLAYRWFCRLGLEDEVPDHSTFGKNRHGRFRESDLFRQVFETVLRRRMDGFDRLCLRGPTAARDEFLLAATVSKPQTTRTGRIPTRMLCLTSQSEGRGFGPTILSDCAPKADCVGELFHSINKRHSREPQISSISPQSQTKSSAPTAPAAPARPYARTTNVP